MFIYNCSHYRIMLKLGFMDLTKTLMLYCFVLKYNDVDNLRFNNRKINIYIRWVLIWNSRYTESYFLAGPWCAGYSKTVIFCFWRFRSAEEAKNKFIFIYNRNITWASSKISFICTTLFIFRSSFQTAIVTYK